MCGKQRSVSRERSGLFEIERTVDRLSHELTCLIDLGVLTGCEDAAFTAVLDDLEMLLVCARRTDAEAVACRQELYRMARMLTTDLDLAYQRLCTAA